MQLREIEFQKPRYPTTRERISAIAWAINRRGRRAWKSNNVPRSIAQYLVEHGYHIEHNQVVEALKVIEEEGFGYRKLAEGGRRVIEFNFQADVQLNGHGLPEVSNGHSKEVLPTITSEEPSSSKPFVLPPIPGAPEPPVYRLEELDALLKTWATKDQESYASWIDTAIESLRENT